MQRAGKGCPSLKYFFTFVGPSTRYSELQVSFLLARLLIKQKTPKVEQMALGASCCPFPSLGSLINQSRWRYQTGSLSSSLLLCHGFSNVPRASASLQGTAHLEFKVFWLSPATLCFPLPQTQEQSAESSLGALQPSRTNNPANSCSAAFRAEWARATPPSTDLPGHGARAMPKPKACVAFPFKHQCPCAPSNKKNQQEILFWEWG